MSRRGGHTLIEVFFALMLLSLTIFSILSVYPSWTASVRKANVLSTATQLAHQTLEVAHNTPWYDLAGSATTQTVNGVDFTILTTVYTPSISSSGSVTTVVLGAPTVASAEPASGPVPLEKDVTVQVLWFSGAAPSSISETTCVYNFPNPR